MNEINFKMPGFFDTGYDIITMKRGKDRRLNHRHLLIEILLALGDQKPTRDQLQKIAKTQRQRFIEVLKALMVSGDVERIGTGTKNDPFRYLLSARHLEPKRKNHFW